MIFVLIYTFNVSGFDAQIPPQLHSRKMGQVILLYEHLNSMLGQRHCYINSL